MTVARLMVAWCTMFVVGTDLFVVSPLLPLIAGDLRLPAASAGLSVTVFAAAYMVVAPLLGQLADRFGRRTMLSWGLVGFALANLLTAVAPGLWCLLAARIAAGIATAAVSPSVYALVGESAPPARRATWMATAVSGLLMSLSVGTPLGALAGAALGWSKVFDVLAGLALLLVLANRRVWPRAATAAGAVAGGAAPGKIARRLLPTVIWATALYGMYTYLGTWLAHLGFTTGQIAWVISFYGGGALVGTFAGGRIADRLGSRTATGISLLGLAACFMLLPLALRPGLTICLAFGVASAVAQIFFPAQQAGLVADFPQRRATVLAWNNSSLFLGIALGSLIGGQAVGYGSFPASLILCAAIALTGWVVNWLVAFDRRPVAA
jgi:MFS transporter, DHA1 family, putative efflux transporter